MSFRVPRRTVLLLALLAAGITTPGWSAVGP